MQADIQMENWASLKREAATLEQYINQRLQSSATGASVKDVESGALLDPESIRLGEIDEAIQRFAGVVEKLSIIATIQGRTAYTVQANTLQTVLHELRGEYRRQAQAASAKRQEAALFAEARARQQARGGGGGDGLTSATDLLLRERGSLTASHSAIDEALEKAAETQSALGRQRSTISSAAGRLGGIADRVPGLKQLMSAINNRKSKNEIIIAIVIAILICFTLWWLLPAPSKA